MVEVRYKLSDRPPWWLVKVLKVISVLSAVVAVFTGLIALVFSWYAESFNAAQEEASNGADNVSLYFVDFLYEAAAAAVGLLFYTVIFWLLALAVDKLDQLVWLSATDEDRSEIIQKRKKKKKL